MQVALVMIKADGTRKEFPLRKNRIVIGRTSDCDLRVPLSSVSRQHCEVKLDGEELQLRDLGSSNGTFHNNKKVNAAELKAGDEIGIGPVVLTVVVDGEPALTGGAEAPPTPQVAAAAASPQEDVEDAPVLEELTSADEETESLPVLDEVAAEADDLPVLEEAEAQAVSLDVDAAGAEQDLPVLEESAEAAADDQAESDKPQALVANDNSMPRFDREQFTPTVELDDPISALEALSRAASNAPREDDDIPLILDDDEDVKR